MGERLQASSRIVDFQWWQTGRPVLRLVLRRLGGALVTLLVISLLVFAATEVLPGDAAAVILGRDATEERLAQLGEDLGLDRPVPVRYLDWVSGAMRGDLGDSYVGRRPVADIIASRLPNSLLMASSVVAILIPISIALGLVAGMRAGRPLDRGISTSSLVALAVPEFVTATLLLGVFAIRLGLLPAVSLAPLGKSPLAAPEILVLPTLTLLILTAAFATRLVRASVADVMVSSYIEHARLNGVNGWRLAVGHVIPNALAPAIQALALVLGSLVGGAIVVETIYGYPGIGLTLQQAVATRDLPLIQGISLTLATITLGTLLIADVLVFLLTPRLRTASA